MKPSLPATGGTHSKTAAKLIQRLRENEQGLMMLKGKLVSHYERRKAHWDDVEGNGCPA